MESILEEIRNFNAEYKEKTGKTPPDEYTAIMFVLGSLMFPELINPEIINFNSELTQDGNGKKSKE